MNRILSALLFYLIVKPLSMLPFFVLYRLSDLLFLLIYYFFPYRKKVVMQNLKNSFPEKSDSELERIAKDFYRHFCDVILETIKLFSADPRSIRDRMEVKNAELLQHYYSQGKSVILVSGHYANWEWSAIALPFHSGHHAVGIYTRLSNKFFDSRLQSARRNSGMELITAREVARHFVQHKNNLMAYGFISDQSPSHPSKGIWLKFLNQETSTITGAEKYAVKFNFPVVYTLVRKKRRGQYTVEYLLVSDTPLKEEEFAITEKCSRINESAIRQEPQYWLWTHKRWKHRP